MVLFRTSSLFYAWNLHISEERNMLIAEKFIYSLVEKYEKKMQFIPTFVLGMMIKHVILVPNMIS